MGENISEQRYKFAWGAKENLKGIFYKIAKFPNQFRLQQIVLLHSTCWLQLLYPVSIRLLGSFV